MEKSEEVKVTAEVAFKHEHKGGTNGIGPNNTPCRLNRTCVQRDI